MTNNEKYKWYFRVIKEESKKFSWKFKSYFTFKLIEDFYFVSHFYVNPNEKNVYGWVDFKPYILDDIFWDIVDLHDNKKMPLSFRSEAAFSVCGDSFYKFDIKIIDEGNLSKEIFQLMKEIDFEISKIYNEYNSVEKFLSKLQNSSYTDSVGILTSLIALDRKDEAMIQIKEFREKKISSGFEINGKDFYQLVEEYYNPELKKDSIINKLRKLIKRWN